MLKEKYALSDKGYANLKKAILAGVITNFTFAIPFSVIIGLFIYILNPFFERNMDINQLWLYLLYGLIGVIVLALAYSNEYKKTFEVSYSEAKKVRIGVAEKLRHLSLSFFNKKNLTEITTNMMGDCHSIETILSHIVPQVISNIISICIVSIMLLFFQWQLTIALFITLPVSIVLVLIARKFQENPAQEHINAKLEVSSQVQEYLEGIKVLQAFGLENTKYDNLKKSLKRMMRAAIKLELIGGSLVSSAMITLNMGIAIVVFIGVNLLINNEITPILFFSFLLISTRIYSPLIISLTMLAEYFYMEKATERMRSLKNEPEMRGNDVTLTNYNISFNDVTFSYNKEIVINDMSFDIKENTITALVGPSGSGKSTISKLISRFWDVDSGSVLVGGIDIKTINPESLMKNMSFVFQEVVLFDDTVFNNIKIGNRDASYDEVIEAAKLARCHEFVEKMPCGYDTNIGENGCTISGGERQRISIARAILKDAPIILLDEATASLDPENEVLIQEALNTLIVNKTVIVIAHRLRTIKDADKIIVLEEGEIVESGKHDELLKNDSVYARLYNIQAESLGWKI